MFDKMCSGNIMTITLVCFHAIELHVIVQKYDSWVHIVIIYIYIYIRVHWLGTICITVSYVLIYSLKAYCLKMDDTILKL